MQVLMTLTLAFACLIQINKNYASLKLQKGPQNYWPLQTAQIYSLNSLIWKQSVTLSVNFLDKNLGKDELFFALPYDPLYYFLTNKPSPTRQLIFFKFVQIPEKQELEIIQDLERHKVNWILLSNRFVSSDYGLGLLGETHCIRIADYINTHFTPVAQFGDWTNPSGWAWNHGTRIYKRIK